MTPSKEDILHKYAIGKDVFVGHDSIRLFPFNDALKAMDEYAKEIAIGFHNWKIERHKEQIKNIGWLMPEPTKIEDVEQLFQLYLNTLKQ